MPWRSQRAWPAHRKGFTRGGEGGWGARARAARNVGTCVTAGDGYTGEPAAAHAGCAFAWVESTTLTDTDAGGCTPHTHAARARFLDHATRGGGGGSGRGVGDSAHRCRHERNGDRLRVTWQPDPVVVGHKCNHLCARAVHGHNDVHVPAVGTRRACARTNGSGRRTGGQRQRRAHPSPARRGSKRALQNPAPTQPSAPRGREK